MELVTVAPGAQLAPGPAASYARMRAAGMPAGITSAYRSLAQQQALRAAYLHGTGAFALPPGQSRHERGEALDLPRPAAAWVRSNPGHGWAFTNPGEWWHCEYRAALDIRAAGDLPPASIAPSPAPPVQSKEDDMKDYVTALYVQLLGRMPDTTGLADALVDLAVGKRTITDIEASIRGSDEYKALDPDERVRKRLALSIW